MGRSIKLDPKKHMQALYCWIHIIVISTAEDPYNKIFSANGTHDCLLPRLMPKGMQTHTLSDELITPSYKNRGESWLWQRKKIEVRMRLSAITRWNQLNFYKHLFIFGNKLSISILTSQQIITFYLYAWDCWMLPWNDKHCGYMLWLWSLFEFGLKLITNVMYTSTC